ncbi:D-alanine--D-alanine ligase [Paenibacillus physcomitrellae]|uniref:D-alanine--D-alanine ligase n=1 Tax=Paenibacillus physcomitrellae TaxID=1619311 RepID=A0ABQ1FTE9_9BACL|nr:D-alanine--D-alanine ligase [Paenibacillus physcomitrellae]GGA29794.1 D-alanine--D-alanine ligase [Paenibacillus physcomitrellae]
MKIGVIMGGSSSEREVSLMTGQEMLANLEPVKYEGIAIEIGRLEELADQVRDIDFALLALHGSYGEDGTVQAALEALGIPYSGSGVFSSHLCMDKHLSKQKLRAAGIATPDWLLLKDVEEQEEHLAEEVRKLGYPVFVKPNTGGSSVGALPVTDETSLLLAVRQALEWDSSVLIEQFIPGDEITCSILGGELLPVLGIRPQTAGWFDYEAKYQHGGAEEEVIVLPEEIAAQVQTTALETYSLLQCGVYARIDMMLKDGIPYVLEANTLPGMTKTSLMPKSAAAAGIGFTQLLDRIIELSIRERSEGEAGRLTKPV